MRPSDDQVMLGMTHRAIKGELTILNMAEDDQSRANNI